MNEQMSSPPLPAGACDCHMHIYDGRFPSVPGARLAPPDALVPAYRALQRTLGLERCVVVTPSTYGVDNRCTVEALRTLERAGVAARGIAVLRSDEEESALKALHAAGVRGVRFNQTLGGTSLDDLEPLAERIATLGWHVEMLLPATTLAHAVPRLLALPVAVVFDHFGRLPHPGRSHPGHRALLDALETGRAWIKLSGAYLQEHATAPEWAADAQAMASAFLRIAPHRLVWGSNWPHPTAHAGLHTAPDDKHLLALLRQWTGDEPTLRRLLVDNPAELYDFRVTP